MISKRARKGGRERNRERNRASGEPWVRHCKIMSEDDARQDDMYK